MPKFLITKTRREIWEFYYEVEAETREKALELFSNGDIPETGPAEYIDTVYDDYIIEEDKHDAA